MGIPPPVATFKAAYIAVEAINMPLLPLRAS